MQKHLVGATKIFKWEMSHLLNGHEGLCKNIHGHSYKMELTVEGLINPFSKDITDPSDGMVIDFGALKKVVQKELIDELDHAIMLDITHTEKCLESDIFYQFLHKTKIFEVTYRPTAENMAVEFFNTIQKILSEYPELSGVVVREVKIWETDTAYATYRGKMRNIES